MGQTKTRTMKAANRMTNGLDLSLICTKMDVAGNASKTDVVETQVLIRELIKGLTEVIAEQFVRLHSELQKSNGTAPEYINLDELYELLNGSIARRTLTYMCADGRVPGFKLGRRWVVPTKDMDEWIQELMD